MLLTLGLFFIVADLVTIIWGRDFHTITPPGFLLESKVIFGHYYPSYRLAVIVVGVVIAIAAYLVFERTQLGAILRAAIEDHDDGRRARPQRGPRACCRCCSPARRWRRSPA